MPARDMDLVRQLLLNVEEMQVPAGAVHFIDWTDRWFAVDGHERDVVIYHFGLLIQAGYVAVPASGRGMTDFGVAGLTWEGHDFLDSVRSPEVWGKTKTAMQKVGGFGLDLMVQVAKAEAKRVLTEKLGLHLP